MVHLPEIPSRIKKLQRNEKGYPVPWFVQYVDGKPDFRIMDPQKWVAAVESKLCWICGEGMGRYKAFLIGPMCAVNRTSSEPPGHRECMEFSAKACPFLVDPGRTRREEGLPKGASDTTVGGIAIKRNPGVALVWITESYKVYPVAAGDGIQKGYLIEIGNPVETLWFAEGRAATRGEILHSFETGLPILEKEARKEGEAALKQLSFQVARAMQLVQLVPA